MDRVVRRPKEKENGKNNHTGVVPSLPCRCLSQDKGPLPSCWTWRKLSPEKLPSVTTEVTGAFETHSIYHYTVKLSGWKPAELGWPGVQGYPSEIEEKLER